MPLSARGTILYLEKDAGELHKNDVFLVKVGINTEGEYINALGVSLDFSKDILEIQDFSKGDSVLSLWVEEPSFSSEKGTISFSGGIPAGFQGWNGVLGAIIFKAKNEGAANLAFNENSHVLLNDGLGTKAKLNAKSISFDVLAENIAGNRDQWQEALKKDNVSPEPFDVKIGKDPLIFEDRHFAIFYTTDKQTGVDYYEVKEGKGSWKKTDSPFLLEDQTLKSAIQVKAVDKAGNERIAEYKVAGEQNFYWILLVLLALSIIILAAIRVKKQ